MSVIEGEIFHEGELTHHRRPQLDAKDRRMDLRPVKSQVQKDCVLDLDRGVELSRIQRTTLRIRGLSSDFCAPVC